MATSPTIIPNDVIFQGSITVGVGLNAPAGCITDAMILASAGIQASKLVTHYPVGSELFPLATTITALASRVLFSARAAGTLLQLAIVNTGAIPAGDHAFTVDLKKSTAGGAFASVLSGVVTFNSSSVLLTAVNGTITTPAYIAGDVFELVVAVSGSTSTQGTGLLATAYVAENYI